MLYYITLIEFKHLRYEGYQLEGQELYTQKRSQEMS